MLRGEVANVFNSTYPLKKIATSHEFRPCLSLCTMELCRDPEMIKHIKNNIVAMVDIMIINHYQNDRGWYFIKNMAK